MGMFIIVLGFGGLLMMFVLLYTQAFSRIDLKSMLWVIIPGIAFSILTMFLIPDLLNLGVPH